MTEIAGYISAIFIGAVLGILGGGGSILTIPVMVYILNISPITATAYSLFVVGITSLIGSANYMKREQINFKSAIVFAIPSLVVVILTRRFILTAIPPKILGIGNFTFTKDIAILIFFAVVMLFASFSMLNKKNTHFDKQAKSKGTFWLIVQGSLVGFITGIVGAGGGFLIVPVLVILSRLPMKTAVGTSLLIIAINSLIGFTGDVFSNQFIDWIFLLKFSAFTIIGIFVGSYLSGFIPGQKLKPVFGWFILLMSTSIILKEFVFNIIL